MLPDSVRNLLRRHWAAAEASPSVPEPALPVVADTTLAIDDDPVWPSGRIACAEALWGEGFLFPGGREETLRLAAPLGLSAASSLLLLGAGTGGASRCITTQWGISVTGYETNSRLVAVANERNLCAGIGRSTLIEPWEPTASNFPVGHFHHAIAIEALRGAPLEPVLGAVAAALKPGGQFALMETVADLPLDPLEPTVLTWSTLAHQPASLPTELGITKILGQLGFDVRIVEDVSQRHMRHAVRGWHEMVRRMSQSRPTLPQTALVVREAEMWLARARLLRSRRLRLVRWHAIGRGASSLA